MKRGSGAFAPAPAPRIFVDDPRDPALFHVAGEIERCLVQAGFPDTSIDVQGRSDFRSGHLFLSGKSGPEREDYLLHVQPDAVRVEGGGRPGVFYGAQTLLQLLRRHGPALPGMTIEDRPAYANRGFYFDISRGKVPSLSTLKRLVDRLAAFKINQLQLYVEHVFAFKSAPDIGRGCDPLTAREILELDRHCKERHVRFVPSLACFGHMGRILSLPRYRGLAEIEWGHPSWEKASWQARLHGATLNPRDPGSRRLMEALLADFLPLFSQPFFNMCGDETYDLGRGKNRAYGRRYGLDRLYLGHVAFMSKLAARHDKRLMLWSDVMLKFPGRIRDLPRDNIVLDWGYEPTTDFGKAARFTRNGLETYVCPSTRGYRCVFNRVADARLNISRYARAGIEAGASGLLNTDWGDMGHFNMLATSLHGMALGAAMAWDPSSSPGKPFDRAFSGTVFGDPTGRMGDLYDRAGRSRFSSWLLTIAPLAELEPGTWKEKAIREERARLRELQRHLSSAKPGGMATAGDLEQVSLALRALQINLSKAELANATGRRRARLARAHAENLESFLSDFIASWMSMNRKSGLPELQRLFRKQIRAASATAPTPRPSRRAYRS